MRFRVSISDDVVFVQDKIWETSDNSKSTNSAHSFL